MSVGALDVLATVARCGPGVTAQEIAGVLRMPPATVYRVLNLLVAEEYLVRMPDLRGFAVGRRAEELIGALAPGFVPVAARERMALLRARVRFGVHLVSYSAGALRLVDPDPDHPPGPERRLARHLHAGAAGKLLLASAPDWRALLSPQAFRPLGPRTVTEAGTLEEQLTVVRDQRFALQVDELRPGSACVAVAVDDAAGVLRAALTISGPSERSAALHEHVELLRTEAGLIRPLIT